MACANGMDHSIPLTNSEFTQNSSKTGRIKICLLGPSEGGKSELVKCLIKGNPYMQMGVKGACFVYGLRVEYDKPVVLDVTECRGKRESQLQQALAQKPDVYFLLYDVSKTSSFKEMRNKWLVNLYPQNIFTIVIGNKADLPSPVDDKIPGISNKAWASGHFEISAITGQQVDFLIQRTAEILIGLEVADQTLTITQRLQECHISRDTDLDSRYKMDATPKGICVIISMRKFEDGSEYRYGTEKDETNLKDLFKQFDFTTEIKTDLKGSEIMDTLKTLAKSDHSRHSCFVCVVMSHGSSKSITASDGMKIDIDEITKQFTADKCVTLRGKPKIFFVQACRGNLEHQSSMYETDSMFGDEEDAVVHIPNEADFLIGRSTVDGYVCYRDTKKGSHYLSMLVEILKANPHVSLVNSMICLNGKIAAINSTTEGPKQMPCLYTTLRKEVILG